MDWINISWKLLAAVAVMQFNRCVVLAFLWKLSFARVLHSVFVGLVTQLCNPSNVFVCVCGVWTRVHTQSSLSVSILALSPDPSLHHAWHTGGSVLTALLCGCSVVKPTFYLHQTPSWLWLPWTLTCLHPTRDDTMVQLMPGFHRIINRGALSSQHLVCMLHRRTLLMAFRELFSCIPSPTWYSIAIGVATVAMDFSCPCSEVHVVSSLDLLWKILLANYVGQVLYRQASMDHSQ